MQQLGQYAAAKVCRLNLSHIKKAYKTIFSSKNLHENLSKIKNDYKDNELVNEVINFIAKDKRRPICLPINQK